MLHIEMKWPTFIAGILITLLGALSGYNSLGLAGIFYNFITWIGLIVMAVGSLMIEPFPYKPKQVIHKSLFEALANEKKREDELQAAAEIMRKQSAEAQAALERKILDNRLPSLQYLLLDQLGIKVEMPTTSPINIEGYDFGVEWDESRGWLLYLYRPCNHCGKLRKALLIQGRTSDHVDGGGAMRGLYLYLESLKNGYYQPQFTGDCPNCGRSAIAS